jgi:AcrR family transcriptional regulator
MTARAHTGRRRNEAARQAVLDATLGLLRDRGIDGLTIEAIAHEAGVGRQTIYRWWPSRAAIVFDAARDLARTAVDEPDTGSLRGDLHAFLVQTYVGGGSPDIAPVLRAMASEALRDPQFGEGLREFTAERRRVLRSILRRHGASESQAELGVEVAYGLLWYRTLVGHAPPDAGLAEAVTELLTASMGRPSSPR